MATALRGPQGPRFIRTLGLTVAMIGLAGCAGMPDAGGLFGGSPAPASAPAASAPLPERTAEAGPSGATAVVESSFTLDGLILPVTRGQTRVETRADRQRTDSAVTFDNWLMRQVAGDGRSASIVRLDRSLTWDLALAKQTYTECPLTGCGTDKAAQPKPEEAQRPKEPSCPVKITVNELNVEPTGERRVINEFSTERYQLSWRLELADERGGRSSNRVGMDLWTTAETGAIRDVKAIDERFGRAYLAALKQQSGPLSGFLPERVASALATLTAQMNANDRKPVERWAAELRKVRGYPIQTSLNWSSSGSVCGDAGGAQSPAGGMAAVGSMLGGMFGGKKDGAAGADGAERPLLTFTQEVRSITVKPVADSVFAPPAGFKRSN